jgi:hypothetical protein
MELLNVEGGRLLFEEKVLPRVRTGGLYAGTIMMEFPATPPLDAVLPEHLKPGRGRPRTTRPHYRYDEDANDTN